MCLVNVCNLSLQIENTLISNQGTIKLCDFGSATVVTHYPDYSWSAQRRATVEDEVRHPALYFIFNMLCSFLKTIRVKVSPVLALSPCLC